ALLRPDDRPRNRAAIGPDFRLGMARSDQCPSAGGGDKAARRVLAGQRHATCERPGSGQGCRARAGAQKRTPRHFFTDHPIRPPERAGRRVTESGRNTPSQKRPKRVFFGTIITFATPESSMPILTAEIHDAHPDEVAVCDVQFRSFGRRLAFAGPCATLKVHEDHRRAKGLVPAPGEGRVLVVDAGGSLRVGIMGDMMAEAASRNGWAGAVIFGAIRDSVAIDALDFGVKALGTTARRSHLDLGGVVGVPVAF